ncbi:hypothetical protein M758_12G142600 [Ceratodon purpureus]|uniref:Uncharacterized protein n=1 Tax=Ceratodon purpureus TaxID=3225 RepID=A0A8T0G989_CERPU|nr:hypothetical protein KC19_12G139000 [Ceratodon purpureus]KAG0599315.1 hypothetical protein M758_12G142600 [Ceratodon purpureus]
MGGDGARKSRYELLWESMSVASRGALDAVDKDEFMECFSQFTHKEKEKLFQIYTRVVAKLQEDVMVEFKPQCEAWELKEVLEELEELVEQHERGGGLSFRSAPLTDAVRAMTNKIKQDEIERLRLLVPREEEHVAQLRLQRAALQAKAREEPTALAAKLAKVRKERAELLLTSGDFDDQMEGMEPIF